MLLSLNYDAIIMPLLTTYTSNMVRIFCLFKHILLKLFCPLFARGQVGTIGSLSNGRHTLIFSLSPWLTLRLSRRGCKGYLLTQRLFVLAGLLSIGRGLGLHLLYNFSLFSSNISYRLLRK